MRLKVLLPIVLLLLAIRVQAQVESVDYKQYKKAQVDFKKAIDYKAKKQNDRAISHMEDAIREYPSYRDAYSLLGEWYYELQQYDNAVTVFRKAMRCKDGTKTFSKSLARCLVKAAKADSALLIISMYKPANADEEWSTMQKQALAIKRLTDSSWLRDPWNDTVRNMGIRINTPYPEMYPSLTLDTETLFFTRRVNNQDEDLYYAHPDTCGGWYTAKNIGAPLNTPEQESAQTISADGHYMFFTRCGVQSENGWDQGDCDLFMAYRPSADSPWSVPQSFGATINTPDYEGMPCLSPDNKELYFVSNRKGGIGGLDIWVSKFEEGLWQAPRNLGPNVNTPDNETAPFIFVDNSTLYFSSNGREGMGGSDLYIARKTDDTSFGPAANLGYPINSTANERSVCVSSDGKTIFFASDRDSVETMYDLYECLLPQPLQPLNVSYLQGYIYDSLEKTRLNGANIIINDSAGHQLYQFQSNRGDGSFTIMLPEGQYSYQVLRVGYTETDGNLLFIGQHLKDPYVYNIPMLPSDYVKPVNDSLILTIHFPKNGSSLSDSDVARIRQAIDPWLMEKGLTVMINGYTDNTGTPIINDQLSYQRANLVSKQINMMGIDELMIKSQGWGEANPVSGNDTEEGRTQNRRVDVIVRR